MIRLENISKEYKVDKQKIRVLNNINLEIKDNEFIAIMGASGSGKTTLLNIIGCMDKASYGTYYLDDRLVSSLNDNELSDIRTKKITFVFQNFALMDKYTAYENIELPLVAKKVKKKERKQKNIRGSKTIRNRKSIKQITCTNVRGATTKNSNCKIISKWCKHNIG